MNVAFLFLAIALQPMLSATEGGTHYQSEEILSEGISALITRSHSIEAFPLEDVSWARVQAKYAAQADCKVEHKEVIPWSS